MTAYYIIIVLVAVGIVFGLLLGFVNNKFSMQANPLVHAVDEILPKGQCGACGYAGCIGYAEAVVNNPDVPVNLCIPGKDSVADQIAKITGKTSMQGINRIAHVKCHGGNDKTVHIFEYQGVRKCVSANLLQGGNKACKFGCLGLGSCVSECMFDALTLGRDGIPFVNPEKCVGCGKCQIACPKKLIELIPTDSPIRLHCNSHDKGVIARKNCSVACIGCKLCEKSCPYNAVTIENNCAVINHTLCIEKCSFPVCVEKCPTKALKTAVLSNQKIEQVTNRWM